MDQRIFDQLDMLERGARVEPRRSRGVHDNSSAEYSAYNVPEEAFGGTPGYRSRIQPAVDEFVDQPMVLDSFDEQLLRQPDYASRQGQAALGRARLSLPPASMQVLQRAVEYEPSIHQMQRDPSSFEPLDLSRFALDPGRQDSFSSSPRQQHLPSSPAFNASQRRPAPMDYGRATYSTFRDGLTDDQTRRVERGRLDTVQKEAAEYNKQTTQREASQLLLIEGDSTRPISKPRLAKNDPLVVQGISLVSTHQALPDRFRAIFPYPLFNAVQSKCFDTIYKTNNNFVLSAPTGSGKTAVLELAICRLINGFANGSYKIVYQAPTKSLCSERQRDWQAKFEPLDLKCAELTGDTDNAQLRNVQSASIIITTPEKWDSITRKWRDHQKLMRMVKLFLIDEVHILKEDRGATLEAVVSRMKSVGSDVRFVALSATVPNSQDIAAWLGKDSNDTTTPATRERFGEEFRPVRLQKHVCGYQTNSNDFAFEKTLNTKLLDVIAKWSQRKPLMVFCFTRNACVETAKLLANWWVAKDPQERYWTSPRKQITVEDKDLRITMSSGVAYHHAGLSIHDRAAIEKGYVEGDIQVICCTSTLAVGVNLPCHMVIIKNTVTYHTSIGGCKEYSDLEIMQMLGRAGRPQFDNTAVAVIMTRLQRVPQYEKMISGQEVLESCLHRNLIDHLNAEIGLGTISDPSAAKKWLTGTFLFVRLKDNPEHYKIEGDAPGRTLEDRLESICRRGISLLEDHDLIRVSPRLQCTEFGDAMARYYLQFDTMKTFLGLEKKSKVSEILCAISQAAEFKEIRFRAGEKTTYKDLNKNGSIKFPILVNIDSPAHKVSLVVQSVLGAVDLPTEEHKQRMEYNTAKAIIFQHVHRLVRCIIDCHLHLDDAVTTRNALMLARSLGAQVWDDSPLHMKQLDGVGLVSVRKLVAAGIDSIEDLEVTEAHRIEKALSRNPPYGSELQEKANAFPKLRVSIKMIGEPAIRKGECVKVNLKADIGFLNEKVPEIFQRKPVYVCLLAETSDGKKVHFARISAKKLDKGQDVSFGAELTSATQSVRAYVMCDEIAGTMRHANLKPAIPSNAFPPRKSAEETNMRKALATNTANVAKRRMSASKGNTTADTNHDEFGDDDINDADLARAEGGGFVDIDQFEEPNDKTSEPSRKKQKTSNELRASDNWEPKQLASGKWACNHVCKDKTQCKHLCCREGVDKKPKPPKSKEHQPGNDKGSDPKQMQLDMTVRKKSDMASQLTASRGDSQAPRKAGKSKEAYELDRLHNRIKTKTPTVPILSQRCKIEAATSFTKPDTALSFLKPVANVDKENMSDYGTDFFDSNDLSDAVRHGNTQPASRMSPLGDIGGLNDPDDEMLDDMDIDTEHFQQSLANDNGRGDGYVDLSSYSDELAADNNDFFHVDKFDGSFGTQVPISSEEFKLNKNGEGHGGGNTFPGNGDIFLGTSSDSAASDLGLPAQEENQARSTRNGDLSSSKFFTATNHGKTTSRTSSAQLREETERLERVLPAEEFLADVAKVEAAAAGDRLEKGTGDMAADELAEWFKGEFGTELFNYTD